MRNFQEFLRDGRESQELRRVIRLSEEVGFPIEGLLRWLVEEGIHLPDEQFKEGVGKYIGAAVGGALGGVFNPFGVYGGYKAGQWVDNKVSQWWNKRKNPAMHSMSQAKDNLDELIRQLGGKYPQAVTKIRDMIDQLNFWLTPQQQAQQQQSQQQQSQNTQQQQSQQQNNATPTPKKWTGRYSNYSAT